MIFYPFNDFDWLCLFLLFRFKKHISVYYILMALADILMPLSVNVYTRNSTFLIKLSALLGNLFGSHFDPELCRGIHQVMSTDREAIQHKYPDIQKHLLCFDVIF